MTNHARANLATLALSLAMLAAAPSAGLAQNHTHHHNHDHAHDRQDQIYRGYFDDAQIAQRPLANWQGEWQSVYSYLQDGTLDPVMDHKAETGDKSAAEYRAYYDIGYRTDTDRITIDGDQITFRRGKTRHTAQYAPDGFEVLTYKKGNRGVRYVFKKLRGDDHAPAFIQFSDHKIAPRHSDHFHLYAGDDRQALLSELTNWPTYYPANLDGPGIVAEMLAH